MNYRKKALLSDQISTFNFVVGQSHDVWRSYSFFAARVASFASVQMMLPRGTQINYMRQKSCDSHYYQYTRPNRTNLFHKEKLFNMKSCGGLQIPFTVRTLPFGPRKVGEHFREGSLSFGLL